MTVYLALFRGMNVGGHNKVKMADLRDMFQDIGLNQVQTYIQSGNVLFESNEDALVLRRKIEQEMKRVFSLELPVVLRTAAEWTQIIVNCPFTEADVEHAASPDVETFYVSLLLEHPTREAVERLNDFVSDVDEFSIRGREVYLLLRKGIRNSKLANNLHRLNVSSTIRNWTTINKLHALASAMKP